MTKSTKKDLLCAVRSLAKLKLAWLKLRAAEICGLKI